MAATAVRLGDRLLVSGPRGRAVVRGNQVTLYREDREPRIELLEGEEEARAAAFEMVEGERTINPKPKLVGGAYDFDIEWTSREAIGDRLTLFSLTEPPLTLYVWTGSHATGTTLTPTVDAMTVAHAWWQRRGRSHPLGPFTPSMFLERYSRMLVPRDSGEYKRILTATRRRLAEQPQENPRLLAEYKKPIPNVVWDVPEDELGSSTLWHFSFGPYTGTDLYVWTDREDYEAAFELAVEWLDDNAPGYLIDLGKEDLKEAAKDLEIEWKEGWPDWNDPDFEKVAEFAEADLIVIGHTTLKHGRYVRAEDVRQSVVRDRQTRRRVIQATKLLMKLENPTHNPLFDPDALVGLADIPGPPYKRGRWIINFATRQVFEMNRLVASWHVAGDRIEFDHPDRVPVYVRTSIREQLKKAPMRARP